MEPGHLGSGSWWGSQAKWYKERKPLGLRGEALTPSTQLRDLGMTYLPGSRCRVCRIVVLEY